MLQVDAQHLLGIVNRGSSKLPINELARELLWFCFRHRITISVEWVPREKNALADEISKMLIPEDWMLSEVGFNTWITDGVPTLWISSRLTLTTNVLGSFPYTDVGARPASMPLDNSVMGRIDGLTARST
jgi:hypothetical protein